MSIGVVYYFYLSPEDEDHVLKWEYDKFWRSLSFHHGKTKNPYELIGKLYEAHTKIVKGLIPFDRFLNTSHHSYHNLVNLIADGYGVLPDAPEPLAMAYQEVMNGYGIPTTLTEPYSNWQESEDDIGSLQLISSGGPFIVAEKIEAEKVRDIPV